MREISFHIISISIALFIFLPYPGFTSDITIKTTPENVFPGDVFLVEVKSASVPSGKFGGVPLNFYPASDGLFRAVSSVDVEMKPGEYSVGLIANGRSIERTFMVHEKKFPVTELTLNSDKVFLSSEDQARVEREDKKLSALWKRITEPMWDGNFVPPLETSISSPFGVVRILNQKKDSRHKGVDYRGYTGKPVKAINSGVVVLTEELFYGGKTAMIDHGEGIYSVYMHLSGFGVKEGDKVKKGDVVGLVGSTGRVTGPHLHLSVKIGEMSVNPESLFALPLE